MLKFIHQPNSKMIITIVSYLAPICGWSLLIYSHLTDHPHILFPAMLCFGIGSVCFIKTLIDKNVRG